MNLKAGDVFCSVNPMALGRVINVGQAFWAKDGKSQYSHAGIILDSEGATFEALWTVKQQNLFKAYAGQRVLVARPLAPPEQKAGALKHITKEHMGRIYPMWRLLLHIVPPVARILSFKGRWLVCSELVAKYLYFLKRRHGEYTGTQPDHLADEWRQWRGYTVVFEGVLPEREDA